MPRKLRPTPGQTDVACCLQWLQANATEATRVGLARFAITADTALGVTVADLRQYAKQLGKDHALAADLWATGQYEARMLACLVDDPKQVTSAQMDRWCKDFDNWAICDTACFHLFDRTAHAWQKVDQWARRKEEFVKRAPFALLASLSVHDKKADDALFLERLPLIEKAADDERNFVKKAVNWALRSIGKRSALLHSAALGLARTLSESDNRAARWIGKDAARELNSASVAARLARKA